MTTDLDGEPEIHHHCKVCGVPVAKWGVTGEARGGLHSYGPKGFCLKHYHESRGIQGKPAPKERPRSRAEMLRHENNVRGLQHYMERRTERIARKCQVSM